MRSRRETRELAIASPTSDYAPDTELRDARTDALLGAATWDEFDAADVAGFREDPSRNRAISPPISCERYGRPCYVVLLRLDAAGGQ